jgi:hypothetical protein
MVTHRWWGDKFCKRTCKNAYARENHRTLSSWVIPQFLFANGACLAAAIAVAVLTLLLASANAAPGEGRLVAGISLEFWSGPIADDLRGAHASETASLKLTFDLDHPAGADQFY